MKRIIFLSLVLFISLLIPTTVAGSSEDSCGFGYFDNSSDYDEDYNLISSCGKLKWNWVSENDGFTSYIGVWIDADLMSDEDGIDVTTTLFITCEKRKLSVQVSADPIGMYPDTNLRNIGTAQVRIDSKKVQNFSYVNLSDSSGVAFSSPKKLTSAILSGNSKVRIKIGTISGYNVSAFPKSDIGSYSSKFQKKGCALR